ncbi:MAG TPA: T9SS type A sorting domain-containing protein, partial [Saprospiraceae bacterium]|nr:T9SS type A sorting domain-containing protein [Saprospiraceae bacterium]
PVVDPVAYITPINGEQSNGLTNILLDWDDTPGANKYVVMYARNSSFTLNPFKEIVTASEYVITETLNENINYYWRVWPYNESMTGAGYSVTQTFKAGLGVGINEIREISGYSLSPNPVTGGMEAMLTLSSTKDFAASLEITDASGHALVTEKILIPSGYSQHPLQTTDLPAGLYFVIMHSEKGNLVERLLILD